MSNWKKVWIVLFAAGLVSTGIACDMDEDQPDNDIENAESAEVTEQTDYEDLDCELPNMQFGDRCCSPAGITAGACKFDREWLSEGGCDAEFVTYGNQYCCGGTYLDAMGAYGFQCVELL